MLEAFKNNSRQSVIQIPITAVYPNPNQPRKFFDDDSLTELSASIREYGILQPVSVRRCGKNEYELIAGERRLKAAQRAGLKKIPAIVVNADGGKSAIMALLENLQREDLSFFEIAEGYQRLIRDQGLTQEGLAKKLGKSQSSIANKLRLLKLSPIVKKIIREYGLSERHARALLNLEEDKQLSAVRTVCENSLNVKQTEEMIRQMAAESEKKRQHIKISAFKDVRLFTNTVKQAVNIMRESGVDAKLEKNDFDWGVEYVIRVKKN